jgi:hypothetical protein
MMAIYMENCLTIGSDKGTEEVIEDLKNNDFGPKIEENL